MPTSCAPSDGQKLLILGCSDLKRDSAGLLPALDRYDGPAYRVLRKFLREHHWPTNVSVGVLSAEHGLFGIFKRIPNYDKRMDRQTATARANECSRVLTKWADTHTTIDIALGRDYLPAIHPALDKIAITPTIFAGAIGEKLSQVKTFLEHSHAIRRAKLHMRGGSGKYLYFLPDWDDLLDPYFDFEADRFSAPTRAERVDRHCADLIRPARIADGILLSLAQCQAQKGLLRRPEGTEKTALAPPPIRQHFGLKEDQYLFGDCGAFSYVNEDYPTLEVDNAVALYESYGFDFGASVDHMPVATITRGGRKIPLSSDERSERIRITRQNAERFIAATRQRKAQFTPVGILHGLDPDDYASSVYHYHDLGYRHMAVGALVPLPDKAIRDIVMSVIAAAERLPQRPWIHLFGIFRPKLQSLFRELKVDSFDSATYFRKAWLRSDQNYLSARGEWYAALRVPMTTDGRVLRRLEEVNADLDTVRQEERDVLRLLCQYDREEVPLRFVLDALLSYDSNLARRSETQSMRSRYHRTLLERPWRHCDCNFCRDIGIHIAIFRGANRNRRRGAHNTLMLYSQIGRGSRDD